MAGVVAPSRFSMRSPPLTAFAREGIAVRGASLPWSGDFHADAPVGPLLIEQRAHFPKRS